MLRARMETRFDEVKRYVRFTDEDASRLLGFRDVARPAFERIAQEFYERIREHEDAHAVFTGEEQIRRKSRRLPAMLGDVRVEARAISRHLGPGEAARLPDIVGVHA